MTHHRRGFSLVIVLVITTALLFVAVAFTDALLQAARAARLGWQGERATHDADASLLTALHEWDPAAAATLRPGESDTLPVHVSPMLNRIAVRSRLSARKYLVESTVAVRDGGLRDARRSIGRAVRLDWPQVPVLAALTNSGHVNIGANAAVLGVDAVPFGWDEECAADTRALPATGIVARNAAVDASATVSGDAPPVRLLSDSARTLLSTDIESAITQLSALATSTTADSVLSTNTLMASDPACPLWFGDARRGALPIPACTRRWPLIVASDSGTTRLTGDIPAQGVLVVHGNLHVDPGVTFAGLVVVRGRLTVSVAAGEMPVTLLGAVIVRDHLDLGSAFNGLATVQSGTCAVRFALSGIGIPVPVRQHGWSERP